MLPAGLNRARTPHRPMPATIAPRNTYQRRTRGPNPFTISQTSTPNATSSKRTPRPKLASSCVQRLLPAESSIGPKMTSATTTATTTTRRRTIPAESPLPRDPRAASGCREVRRTADLRLVEAVFRCSFAPPPMRPFRLPCPLRAISIADRSREG